jgi:hypothetical protein
MRILLVNVPHPAIGSRIPDDHLPPLGLLAMAGRCSTTGTRCGCSTPSSVRCRQRPSLPLLRDDPTVADFWGAPQDHEEDPWRQRDRNGGRAYATRLKRAGGFAAGGGIIYCWIHDSLRECR